jgi:hypothetical protein
MGHGHLQLLATAHRNLRNPRDDGLPGRSDQPREVRLETAPNVFGIRLVLLNNERTDAQVLFLHDFELEQARAGDLHQAVDHLVGEQDTPVHVDEHLVGPPDETLEHREPTPARAAIRRDRREVAEAVTKQRHRPVAKRRHEHLAELAGRSERAVFPHDLEQDRLGREVAAAGLARVGKLARLDRAVAAVDRTGEDPLDRLAIVVV